MSKFKVGDKVKIPTQKTDKYSGICLKDSTAIEEAKKKNQNFLYIVKINKTEKEYTVGVEPTERHSTFAEVDLELYEENFTPQQININYESKALGRAMQEDLEAIGYIFRPKSRTYGDTLIVTNRTRNEDIEKWGNFSELYICSYACSINPIVFNLPEDYTKALDYAKKCKEYFEEREKQEKEIKVGDYITCLREEEFIEPVNCSKGAGYIPGKTYKVAEVRKKLHHNYNCYMPEGASGIYNFALRKATPEEIEAYNSPKEVTLKLGSNNVDIIIGKGKIECRGANLTLQECEFIIGELNRYGAKGIDYHKENSQKYDVTINKTIKFIRIGCEQENNLFSIEEIQKVIDTYKELNK